MTRKIIFIIIIILILAGAGYFIWQDLTKPGKTLGVKKETPSVKEGLVIDSKETTKEVTEKEVENLPIQIEFEESVPLPVVDVNTPSLDRAIVFTVEVPEEAKQLYIDRINKISSELMADLDLFNSWLVLGIYRKQIGDYVGAREVWDYAGKIRPLSSTPFNNLGDLYAYYIKDNDLAEQNFLKAIENGPDQIYIYRSLRDFYLYVLKDEAKAKAILEQGVFANPSTSQDLQYLLENY